MDFREKQSIYLQIADHICDEILVGKWPEEERIPSVRDLAVSMEVNPHTILRSYEYLVARDIIFNKRGLGYSVSSSAKKLITAIRKQRFMEVELPAFFSSLALLDISMEEVRAHYEALIQKHNPVSQ